jgi:hypothetical protein
MMKLRTNKTFTRKQGKKLEMKKIRIKLKTKYIQKIKIK